MPPLDDPGRVHVIEGLAILSEVHGVVYPCVYTDHVRSLHVHIRTGAHLPSRISEKKSS